MVACAKCVITRGADKSLAQPGRKQARKHVRDARDFNNIETRAVIRILVSCKARQGKAPKEIHSILTETLDCFLPAMAKDLSATLEQVHKQKHPSFDRNALLFFTMTKHIAVKV